MKKAGTGRHVSKSLKPMVNIIIKHNIANELKETSEIWEKVDKRKVSMERMFSTTWID